MSKKQHFQNLLKNIEDSKIDKLNINNLSRIGYISSMQLYRDFYNFTGHSVNEYIRKRRLSNALALIKHSSMSITDIAFMCGYSSHQNFTNAVRKAIGLSPTEYRKNDMYFYFPAYITWDACKITVKKKIFRIQSVSVFFITSLRI